MAHVLNRQERNQAFWKFLFFFLLSTAMIVGAVYFDVRIPSKDNEILREQVFRYKNQQVAQEKFVKSMDDARQLIDSLNKPGANAAYLNLQVNAKIRELADLQYKDSSMYSRLNKNVHDVFLRYLDATNKSVSMGDLPDQLQDYKARYEQSQRDLEEARRDLDILRKATSNTGF